MYYLVINSTSHQALYVSLAEAATKVCLCRDKNIFVATNIITFVATKQFFCRDKSMLVATKLSSRDKMSRQTYFCRDKTRLSSRQT